jgi:signal transduction histidine kinase
MSAEIDTAIADFRRIVHGVYPPVLTDHGLRAAMESLLAELHLQATLAPPRIPRLAARVEVGTYFCAAALLREWHGSGARHLMRVYVGVTGRQIEMTFVDGMAQVPQGAPAEVPEGAPARAAAPVSPLVLEAVRDRVAAMGGRMISGNDESNRWLAIEVPLATADLTPHAAPDGDTP